MNHIDTDYLVIGSGTAGLAFTDTLIDESDAHVTIVDRRGKPGGRTPLMVQGPARRHHHAWRA